MLTRFTLPAASAMYIWFSSCGSGTTARILEGSLNGLPLSFLDLAALRAVSLSAELLAVSVGPPNAKAQAVRGLEVVPGVVGPRHGVI